MSQVATRLVERRERSELGVANAILLLLEEDPYQQDVGQREVQQIASEGSDRGDGKSQ